MKPFKCDNVQYLKKKNTELQYTIERLCQYTTLWSEFTKLLCSKGLGYDSFRNKERKFYSKISN